CYDGQNVIVARSTATLSKIDPATRAVVGSITLPSGVTARFIAFDPTADNGNGGYWVGNWNAGALNYFLVSKTGAQLRVLANTAITGTYGIAFDDKSQGGPFLWAASQGDGTAAQQLLIQVDYNTGLATGVTHNVAADVGAGQAAPIMGGLFTSTDVVTGKFVIGGVLQGTPDRLFGYEIATLGPPPGPGFATNASPAHNATNVDVTTHPYISWSNPAAAVSNKVYFSTDGASVNGNSPAALVSSGSLATSYNNAASLQYGTSYFWKVVEVGATDSTNGPVWKFSTKAAPAPKPATDVMAAWTNNPSKVTVTWVNPTQNIFNEPITVDSTVIWRGDVRAGKVTTTTQTFVDNLPPNGFHVYKVVSFASGFGSVPAAAPVVGVGLYYTTFSRNGLNLAIPDNSPSGVEDVITIPSLEANIAKVMVVIDTIIHTWDADLDISLVTPGGATIDLTSDNGSSGDNYINCTLDDEAAALVTTAVAPMTGSWKPEATLSGLANTATAGNWSLKIVDDASSDTGVLQAWKLILITTDQLGADGLTLVAPNGGEVLDIGTQYNVRWNATGVTTVKIEYSTNNGTAWSTVADNVPAERVASVDPASGSRKVTEGSQPMGSYTWTIPNTPSTSALVKVTANNNAALTDVSNAVFTIRVAPVTNVKYEENFNGSNTQAGLEARGWKWINQDGGGTTFIYNGVASVFTAFEGPDTGYAAQNYSGANGVYIDQWLISKQLNIAAGDSLTFWYRSTNVATTNYPDTIQVLYSPTGDTAMASFTHSFGYFRVPNGTWTYWAKSFPSAGATGRFAIRYIVYDGGATGSNSDYWGLDLLKVVGAGGPPPAGWSTTLNVKDAGTTNGNLVFGQHPQATDGIDAALGELSLPPAPPAGVFDARFILPVTPADASLKDFRNDTLRQANWKLTFQPTASGYPFTLTWDPATLGTGSFMLKDEITGTIVNVNMKTTNSYTLTNTGISSLKIEFTKTATATINTIAGWNIFSVPLNPTNPLISAIFPAATSPAYAYQNGYVTATDAAVDKGYWIRLPQAGAVNVSGNAVAANTVPLVAGWNLIGVHMNPATVTAITTTPAGIINSPFYGYNGGYSTPTALESGKGYWVRASAAGVINLPAAAAKGGEVAQTAVSKDWGKITIIDREGKSVTLYAANGKANLSSFDLPPVPPAGIFDVRFASQRSVEVLGTESQDVMINSAEYPVTVRIEGVDVRVRDRATNGQIINQVIRNNGTITLTNSAVNVLGVETIAAPASFELSQNFPNPFNPSTTIKFGLAEKSNVSLTIYNQLGEKVAVLLNGEMEAGYHKVEWNASNMTSGVYFYEIKAGSFTSVKKLMLMK
ncbi:MAG: choice-of-anchor J domain-containing protein, partial [Ignavibacteriales bacterium]|nr:choice-of-anchor J domain-containing protein [Ignavibacteriales bacterium]